MDSKQKVPGTGFGIEVIIEVVMVSIVFSAVAYGVLSINQIPVFAGI